MRVVDSTPMQIKRVQILHSRLLQVLADIKSRIELEDNRLLANYMVDIFTTNAL